MMIPPFHLRTESGFECFGQADHLGQEYGLGADLFEGWGPVETKGRPVDRVGDGEHDVPAYRAGRLLTVGGIALARTWGEVGEWRDQIAALPTRGDKITVEELGQTRWALGGVRGKPRAEPYYRLGRPALDWEITWACPMPYRYGDSTPAAVAPGSTVQVVNRGTHEASPIAVVTGPISSGWSILGFKVNRAVASGETVTVDAATASVVSSTVGELMNVVTGYPLFAPVGVSTVTFNASGSGNAVVTVTDTYQ